MVASCQLTTRANAPTRVSSGSWPWASSPANSCSRSFSGTIGVGVSAAFLSTSRSAWPRPPRGFVGLAAAWPRTVGVPSTQQPEQRRARDARGYNRRPGWVRTGSWPDGPCHDWISSSAGGRRQRAPGGQRPVRAVRSCGPAIRMAAQVPHSSAIRSAWPISGIRCGPAPGEQQMASCDPIFFQVSAGGSIREQLRWSPESATRLSAQGRGPAVPRRHCPVPPDPPAPAATGTVGRPPRPLVKGRALPQARSSRPSAAPVSWATAGDARDLYICPSGRSASARRPTQGRLPTPANPAQQQLGRRRRPGRPQPADPFRSSRGGEPIDL